MFAGPGGPRTAQGRNDLLVALCGVVMAGALGVALGALLGGRLPLAGAVLAGAAGRGVVRLSLRGERQGPSP